MAVNCGACIAPVVQHRMHGLLYSSSMTDTLGTSVGSSILHLMLCCLRSLGCRLCRFFGGDRLLKMEQSSC